MTETTNLVIADGQLAKSKEQTKERQIMEIRQQTESRSFLDIIEKALFNPNLDFEKLNRLLDIQERIITKQSESEFNVALAEMQPNLPVIEKTAKAHGNIKYAPYDEIMREISPVLGQYGFAISFEVESTPSIITVIGTLAHRGGHSKKVSLPLSLDKSGNKQDIHAIGSTLSYGKRYVVGLLINLAFGDEDDDASKAQQTFKRITDDQIQTIEDWIESTKTDKAKFLLAYKINSVSDIPAEWFDKIIETFKNKAK